MDLEAIIAAADKPAVLDPAVVQQRNHDLDQLLETFKRHVIDVNGDGNCFYRAVSVGLHGHEEAHADIRQSVARDIRNKAASAPLSSRATLLRRADEVSRNKSWPGEDVVYATAVCLKRVIHVYVAGGSATPLSYEPTIKPINSSPLTLALYEPGHYRAVTQQCAVATSILSNISNVLNQ